MEAVYGVEGFPKLWFELRSKNILVVNQSNSMLQVSLVQSLHQDLGGRRGKHLQP